MGFNDFLTKIFGNKSQRDLKEIMPIVDKIKAIYPQIAALDNDGLRARTAAIKQQLRDIVADERAKIADIRAKIDDTEINEREKLYAEIDKLEKQNSTKLEQKLDEVLPETFAIVKDTARRFKENDQVVVTANDFDRKLAATHDFVEIDGD